MARHAFNGAIGPLDLHAPKNRRPLVPYLVRKNAKPDWETAEKRCGDDKMGMGLFETLERLKKARGHTRVGAAGH